MQHLIPSEEIVAFDGTSRMIELTQEQRQAFSQGRPVRLRDPELNADLVVCPAALFREMERQLENLEDAREQEEWIETSMEDLTRSIEEDEDDRPRVRSISPHRVAAEADR